MDNSLLSVGIDVGTSTTQLVVSRLGIENRASAYSVPDLEIQKREILYQSPIHFTPLLSETVLDAEGIRGIVKAEYQKAGLSPEKVATGAIIITGETARKENAREVLQALKDFAGQFVVATAGPDLESVLAAKGSGAVAYSKATGKTVLHTDIGGGTSNMALIEAGEITATGCLNVGGRLIRVDRGRITYLSPVLRGLTALKPGDAVTEEDLAPVISLLVGALEKGCGLLPGEVPPTLLTNRPMKLPQGEVVFSFSGGVAELMDTEMDDPFTFGDIGVLLARSIRQSPLCQGDFLLGEQTIRATVIGAGCYSTQLSGSTVYGGSVPLPVQNLPVAVLGESQQKLSPEGLREYLQGFRRRWDREAVAVYLPGLRNPSFQEVTSLTKRLAPVLQDLPQPRVLLFGTDMAKVMGQSLAAAFPGGVMCLDGVKVQSESFLDVGAPVADGAAYPVVVKTLVFEPAAQ